MILFDCDSDMGESLACLGLGANLVFGNNHGLFYQFLLRPLFELLMIPFVSKFAFLFIFLVYITGILQSSVNLVL